MSFNLDHASFALKRAENLVRDAEVLVPQNHPAREVLGEILTKMSDAEESIKSAEQAINP
jgi:hypothetical protein